MALLETFARLGEGILEHPPAGWCGHPRGRSAHPVSENYSRIAVQLRTCLLFLDATDESLVRRFSETRRPHPRAGGSVLASVQAGTQQLEPSGPGRPGDRHLGTHPGAVAENGRRDVFRRSRTALRVCRNQLSASAWRAAGKRLVFRRTVLPNPNYVPNSKALSGQEPGRRAARTPWPACAPATAPACPASR